MLYFPTCSGVICFLPAFKQRRNIKQIGEKAAKCSTPTLVSRQLLSAARWLESQDLAVLNQNNQMVLTDSVIQTSTILRLPALVCNPPNREDQSLWSLRKELVRTGWTLASEKSSPSIAEKVANGRNACKMYFILLLDCTLLRLSSHFICSVQCCLKQSAI